MALADLWRKVAAKTPTTLLVLAAAAAALALYNRWIRQPWTRDGQVRADVVRVAPRVSGYVVEVAVRNNQFVRRGELLFRIDPSSYRLAVDHAEVELAWAGEEVAALEAAVRAARARVGEAKSAVTSAQGQVTAAEAALRTAEAAVKQTKAGVAAARAVIRQREANLEEAKRESDRAQRLLDQKAGSLENAQRKAALVLAWRADVDSAGAGLDQAEAKVAEAEAGRREAEAGVAIAGDALAQARAALATAEAGLDRARADLGEPGEANVRVRKAKVQLEQARLNLEWTTVLAPCDGYVSNLYVDEGTFGVAGHPLIAFVDAGSFRVHGFFEETKLRHIRPGDPAVVVLMGHPDVPLEGTVDSIGNAVQPPGVAPTEGEPGVVPEIQPTFNWVRLAQRVPVTVRLHHVPEGVRLVSGTTASVAVRPGRGG